MPSPGAQLTWLSLAMFLAMTLWFSATAANAAIAAEFHLSAAQTAWLTMAVQGGFVLGTLASAILNLPDVLSARRLFTVGCLIAGAANAALIAAASATAVVVLRLATGAALAWVYPPGMKIAAGWFEERRGAALGVLIGALTIGSAFPHLLAVASATLPWRTLMSVASGLAVVGAAVVALFVADGPYVAASAPFDRTAVARALVDRETRLATLAYLGHMWELYAVWTWIAAFASAGAGITGATPASRTGSAVAFVTIASGAVGSAAAGWFADRLGRARIAAWAMMASGVCCMVAGFLFGAPPPLVYAFACVWGVTVVADSAQLSALVAQYSRRDHVGTALTVQMCAGFLLTMMSIRAVPIVAAAIGWRWAFIALAPGPAFGVVALRALSAGPLPRRQPSPARMP